MIPVVIYEKIIADTILNDLGISDGRVFELQSVDERPFNEGYFLVINWQESGIPTFSAISRSPRIMSVWVHTPMDRTRDYAQIEKILNRIEILFFNLEQQTGSDGIRVTCIIKQGRSGNLIDDAWKTITRNATYGVLYDESVV